ncbi:MAG: phosphoribosylanthranilate isomerase [Pseudomonadota bacterium]
MSLEVKICGINTPAALDAAVAAGADLVGFVFYPNSPRAVTPAQAIDLAGRLKPGVKRVALMVDPDDALVAEVTGQVPLDFIQLHGAETPRRVAEIRARTGLAVIKVLKLSTAEDLAPAETYAEVADRLLFDAKPPKSMKNALPGGNALAFDWRLLAGKTWSKPWMLSGGLEPDNLKQAVEISGARSVDVSSGVEERPGLKSPEKIDAFLAQARAL